MSHFWDVWGMLGGLEPHFEVILVNQVSPAGPWAGRSTLIGLTWLPLAANVRPERSRVNDWKRIRLAGSVGCA